MHAVVVDADDVVDVYHLLLRVADEDAVRRRRGHWRVRPLGGSKEPSLGCCVAYVAWKGREKVARLRQPHHRKTKTKTKKRRKRRRRRRRRRWWRVLSGRKAEIRKEKTQS